MLPELPWADCNNDWNTDKCRNPYEVKFNESCKMSEDYHPCSEVGTKYGDCKVRTEGSYSIEMLIMFVKDGAENTKAVFCTFENNLGETVSVFVKNVTDPVSEFWENKALQQSAGVNDQIFLRLMIIDVIMFHLLG